MDPLFTYQENITALDIETFINEFEEFLLIS